MIDFRAPEKLAALFFYFFTTPGENCRFRKNTGKAQQCLYFLQFRRKTANFAQTYGKRWEI